MLRKQLDRRGSNWQLWLVSALVILAVTFGVGMALSYDVAYDGGTVVFVRDQQCMTR